MDFCRITGITRDEDGDLVGGGNIEVGKKRFCSRWTDNLTRPIEVIGCEGAGDLALIGNNIVCDIWRERDIRTASEDAVVWRGRKGVIMSGDYLGKVGFTVSGSG